MEVKVADIFINQWDDLKADQAAVLLFWRDRLARAVDREKHEAAGFYKSMIVRFLLKDKKIFKKLSTAQVRDIADDLTFIHDPWYTFHVTWLKTKRGVIYRPDYKMASFTFWQLIMADAHYSKFLILNHQNSKEQEHVLNKLIAVIYQPSPGQFTDTTIEDYSKLLPKGLSMDLKYLILHTYSNIRKYIVNERCPDLFNPPPEPAGDKQTDPGTEAGNTPQYTGNMWQQMLFDLAETPAFSGLENAKNARMYDALDYLNKKAVEAKNKKK